MLRFNRSTITLILIIFIFPLIMLAGETGKIAGKVIDKSTGEPIIGANVFVDAVWVNGKEQKLIMPQGASTDVDGFFTILPLRPGDYTIKCSLVGYEKMEITNVKVLVDRMTEVNFNLSPTAVQSEEVIVTAYRPGDVEKDLTATKTTYDIDNISTLAGINSISDILTLQADVVDNHFRGGREGEASYLIAGGSINNPLDASKSFDPMTNALQTVEVLTSGFSAEYGNAQSGVINMVPKEGGDKWASKIDLTMEVPHYQVWGGNPYSKDNWPLYDLLTNPSEWLRMFYDIGVYRPYFDKDSRYGSFVSRHYAAGLDSVVKRTIQHNDSLKAAKFGIANWKQATRDIGTDDQSIPEHKLNIVFGGPLSESIRLFVAL